ncbi:NAD(P)-dependent oxidoreductase [Mycobacterium sp. ACS4331]|uniref:NAD(P)-dependent oxidoreductase n=1 Tax=Mycobacterium sp. ACS4331 TaxID=1834121 RepID=UPI0008001464|nr:NAD(P)-dependent oxidoreductase [Mycobacterium sp. ACS4331]OBF14868.1 6-phosphogluconate dehydrogenase [Mycobacterium sp. ACS4331]
MKVGFVGAGRMGAPMVVRLIDAGHEVVVLGRTPERRDELTSLGARAVAEPREVAAGADIVVVCVFTDGQVRQLCLGSEGLVAAMRSGSVLVLHTTGSPRTAEALAAEGERNGVAVIDAPVSGGPHDIAAGSVTLFVGGADDAVCRVRPALESYGDPIVHVGGVGTGQKMKLVNNTLFAAQVGLIAEAARLAGTLGIEESALLEALPHGSGASRAVGNVARAGSSAAFISAVAEFIGKDVAVVRETAAELGADLGRLDQLVEAGLGR